MAEQEQTTPPTASGHTGNGKNVLKKARDADAAADRSRSQAPMMAMEDRPEMPIAAIIREWLEGANEHYRRAGLDLTASYARKLLELEDQRHTYMRRMLETLTKD